MKNSPIILCAAVILSALSGCAKYKPKSFLKNLSTPQVSKESKESTISLAYHIFDEDDCMFYLDRNLIAQEYQPVQITFTNNSDRYLNFSTASFTVPCESVQIVAEEAHTNTVGRAVGYGIAGLFIWPFIIPAIVDGLGSSKANRLLDRDFSRKALRDQIVPPHTTINGLIFVPNKSFKPDFSFRVADVKNNDQFTLGANRLHVKV